ncbi:MAG TPA: ribonuclease E inhibitor RraB [Acidiferrobacteraceae bacterium]|nr:ribonuclease E inhibitor RraB [Acidiferrobacteraceae bacterium]
MVRSVLGVITACYVSLVLAGGLVVNRSDQEQLNDNQSLFKIMDEAGARPDTFYQFDQVFRSLNEEDLRNAQADIIVLGYRADKIVQREEDKSYYAINAKIVMVYNKFVIARHSIQMLKLAKKYNIIYDGWGVQLAAAGEKQGDVKRNLEDSKNGNEAFLKTGIYQAIKKLIDSDFRGFVVSWGRRSTCSDRVVYFVVL